MKIRHLRTSLMVSVSAIALIAGASIAAAQDRGGQSGGGGAGGQPQAPSAQPGGGDNKAGGDVKGRADTAPKAAPKGGQAEQRNDQKSDQKGERPQRAQDDRKQRDQKGAQDQRDKDRDNRAQDKPDRKDSKDSASDKKSGRDSTTGQGAAGRGGGSITAEQRTRITTTIRQSNVRPVTNVNFNIRVGSAIPRTVTLNPLPAAVIEVYPDWRGYRFILVGNDILVIDPDTYQIVAVLDA
jgi:hypothetical protein